MRGFRLVLTAGMASYLDAGALVATGLAVGVFYRSALSLGNVEVGVLLGLQTLAFAVGALVGGRWGDRVGRRRVLVLALAAYAVGVALLAVAWSTPVLRQVCSYRVLRSAPTFRCHSRWWARRHHPGEAGGSSP